MPGHRLTAVTALALALTLGAGAGSAEAAGYRYWSFWDRQGTTWTYATQGPATAHPSDGDVQGFRFAVSADSKDAATPRSAPTFAEVCASTPAKPGRKRVALALDFGTPQDAPGGETPPAARTACAQVPEDATTADALAAVAKPLRYNSAALLCAIAGYPHTGCGEQVSGKTDTRPTAAPKKSSDSSSDSGPSLGLMAGIAAIVTLAAAAIWQSRRRRD
ncbi:SCO2322 family protein [Streptomyces sp. BPTC-684]|uniref:SCO2322 family protein n=1 Tax=Streptomyces sp. BPTC-684 TaxID=3043734 RepID=UPI0024B1D083|nr:SCO2322 family protein [Streptomyces sp. BPTC-684]WHM38904.1 SCO2322 family protein [Streptomyces sp. BPTC-684]